MNITIPVFHISAVRKLLTRLRFERFTLPALTHVHLILPGPDCPNLASRVLALCCERLADDWPQVYGHPVLVAESFVDSHLFRGTCYKAQGWKSLGETQGSGRNRQDYYTAHGRPKQLWVRELRPKARAAACLPDRPPAVIPPSGAHPAMNLPPVPCVTAASEDKNNRSRHERRSLRWVAADAETLCCAHVRSVVEITRETTVLRGKNKGKTSIERIIYICSLEPDAARGEELLERIRRYWDIEGGLHQRLDVSGGEDASRVRNRNAILVLGILRRSAVGIPPSGCGFRRG